MTLFFPAKKEKKPKKKKAEKPSKATKPAKEGEQRENLCPNTPYNPKKYRRHMVKDWLASLGREGPALPVPDNDFYPDYADPNMANAMAEIEDLQEAYSAFEFGNGPKLKTCFLDLNWLKNGDWQDYVERGISVNIQKIGYCPQPRHSSLNPNALPRFRTTR